MSSRAVLLFVCASLSIAARASAQTPPPLPLEVYGGYSYLRDPGNSVIAATAGDNNFHIGWAAGVARPLWRHLDLVGEASGHYKTRTTFDEDVRLSFHGFLGGPRGSIAIGRFREFGQVLAGVVRAHGSAFGVSVATTAFALQPGGGIDYPIGARVAARVQLDYRWINGDEFRRPANQFRAVAAVVVR
jgi:hypothetical protein